MGDFIPPRRRHGSVTQTQGIVDGIGSGALSGVLQHALLLVVAALVPGLGPAVVAAFMTYKLGIEALKVKKDYDEAAGSPEQRATKAAIKEGIRVGIAWLAGDEAGPIVEKMANKTASTTADELGKEGTFKQVANGMGLPQSEAGDFQDFFSSSLSRAIEGAFEGAEDEIGDYVAEKV